MVSSPGATRSKPQTPRAERRRNRHSVITASLCTLQTDVHRVMGRLAPRRSARPHFPEGRDISSDYGRASRPPNNRAAQRWLLSDQQSRD